MPLSNRINSLGLIDNQEELVLNDILHTNNQPTLPAMVHNMLV